MDYGLALPGTEPGTGRWGATTDYDIMQQECVWNADRRRWRPCKQEHIRDALRMVHQTALVAGGPTVSIVDMYPDHIWSNLFETATFRRLDKRRIVEYRWVEKVLCVDRLHHATRVQVERSMIVPVTAIH